MPRNVGVADLPGRIDDAPQINGAPAVYDPPSALLKKLCSAYRCPKCSMRLTRDNQICPIGCHLSEADRGRLEVLMARSFRLSP